MRVKDRVLRWWSPRLYCKWMIRRVRRQQAERLQDLGVAEQRKVAADFHLETLEWVYWLQELDDMKLISRAKKMDVDLDDLPVVPHDDHHDELGPHYHHSPFGDRLLRHESSTALKKLMRDRAPSYRREKRERWQLLITGVAALTGLVGTATGFIALLKK